MQVSEHHTHQFPPVYDEYSRILILGSFPSVKSREQNFYYGHPQNRFWKLTALLMNCPVPVSMEEKKQFLHRYRIAVWDVIESCDIVGSSDSSIRNVVPTDINRILETADIKAIYTNGGKAAQLYKKYQQKACGRECIALPSTSPANAAWNLERLALQWRQIADYLGDITA